MQKLNLLIVDDDEGSRSLMKNILHKLEVNFPFCEDDFCYEVLESSSGEKAVEILGQSKIDIVLVENNLPGIEGIRVVDYVKGNHLDTAVIMITSSASMDLAIRATNSGAFNFITKPFSDEDLKSSVESITKHLFLKRMTRKMNHEAKQVRYRFLSLLSHELKSPINTIEGYLRMMQDRPFGNDISKYTHMIDRSLARLDSMRGLIMDMLDLTRIETGSKSRVPSETDLVQLAKMAIDSIQPLAIQKNVDIIPNLPEKLSFVADATEIEIIFNNLLSNAVKYNRENGKVFLSLEESDMEVCISVEDTGIGMTKGEQSRLFKEFSRIHNPSTRHISGTGLGLSITKRIVANYKGDIEVSSTPDIGSIFTLKLKAEGAGNMVSIN